MHLLVAGPIQLRCRVTAPDLAQLLTGSLVHRFRAFQRTHHGCVALSTDLGCKGYLLFVLAISMRRNSSQGFGTIRTQFPSNNEAWRPAIDLST
jgi:hypothetical protein